MNVAVTFLKAWRHYNPGETAGFSEAQADRLVAGKVAELAPLPATEQGKGTAKKAAKTGAADTGGDGGTKTGGDTSVGGADDGNASKQDA